MIILLVHIFLLIAILQKMPLFSRSGIRTVFWALLLAVKAVAGYSLIVYYDTRYGGSDMRGYLEGANTVHRIFLEDPVEGLRLFTGSSLSPGTINRLNEQVPIWYGRPELGWFSDSRTVIRIQTLLRFVSGGNIWVHLLWTNLAALAGGLSLIRFFRQGGAVGRIPFWTIGLLFIPNGLLWSSTILKEPFLILALGFTLSTFREWLDSGCKNHGWPLLLALLLFLLVKPFWLMVLLPGLTGWAAFRRTHFASPAVPGAYVLALLLAMTAGWMSSNYHLPSLLFGEQLNMLRFSVFGGAGSLIEPVGFAPTWISVIKHIPETFIVTMSQPVPGAWNEWESLFLFSENILFFLLLIAVVLHRGSLLRIWSNPPLMLCSCTGFIILLVSGFTTPVAGTLIRYRWPGVLLLMLVFGHSLLNRSGAASAADSGERPD